MAKPLITAFTDGSYTHSAKRGGWGVYSHFTTPSGCVVELDDFGHIENATSSGHVETIAIWNCLSSIPSGWSVELWGDNQYTIQTMIDGHSGELIMERNSVCYTGYMRRWDMVRGTKKDGCIKNVEWWRRINTEVERILSNGGRVKLNWMRGHSKDVAHPCNYGNERADSLACKGEKNCVSQP